MFLIVQAFPKYYFIALQSNIWITYHITCKKINYLHEFIHTHVKKAALQKLQDGFMKNWNTHMHKMKIIFEPY